jgi:hypothetical protein
MRDVVHVYITSALPIRAHALPFADRIEVRFGKAFPVVLVVERDALDPLIEEITTCRNGLHAARDTETEKGGKG